jgi:hypothetical protein
LSSIKIGNKYPRYSGEADYLLEVKMLSDCASVYMCVPVSVCVCVWGVLV